MCLKTQNSIKSGFFPPSYKALGGRGFLRHSLKTMGRKNSNNSTTQRKLQYMLPSLLYMWTFFFFGLRNQSPHLWQGMIPKSFMDGLHYFIIYW